MISNIFITPILKQPADPNAVLKALIAAHSGSGNPGKFGLERGEQIFHVMPTAIKDNSGRMVPQKSLLDVAISIRPKERDGLRMLEALCAELTKSVQLPVVVGTVPYGLFLRHKENQGVDRAKARDFLVQSLGEPATERGCRGGYSMIRV